MRTFFPYPVLPFLIAGALLFPAASAVFAQGGQQEEFPEINDIRFEFDAFQPVSDEFIRSNIQLRPGMEYDPALSDRSIRNLYDTGHFDFVEVRIERVEDSDKVDVIFEFVPKYRIGAVEYSGNEAFSDSRLGSESELETGGALDEFEVSLGADRIEEFYIEKGFKDVQIDYRIERDQESGRATVDFEIEEGGRVRIVDLEFEGNEEFSDGQLRRTMETGKRRWYISWLTGSGRFDESQFKEDLEALRARYRNAGYLDVRIDEDAVDIAIEDESAMSITIPVEEGKRYSVGEFSVENNTIYTDGELLGAVSLETGDRFSPEKVDQAAESIREHYTSRGYLDTNVRAERSPNIETRRIDVVFRVRESERFFLESIEVEGNTKTRSRVILRELALRPGEVFDLTRMETSQQRLENTRLFENVRLRPEETDVPGRRDLNVAVREGQTGNLSFGAGFGSVESAVVFFEFSQGNFDLFNWRSGFQGDGQKFRFRTSLGTRSNEVTISFEEPWLFEQRLAFGAELFRKETDFQSSEFNELRTGFEVFLRRRLFELVEGRLSYRAELVDIFDVDRGSGPVREDGSVADDGIADVFQAAEGEDFISKVGFSLLRDNRDSLLFTRSGNRTKLDTELAGIGGDINYYRLEGRTAHFIPTFEALQQTFSIVARAGTVAPFGDSEDVPFYDKFFLGGPDSLRGFDFRDVGPRDEDDPDESIGGKSFAMFSLEYTFRLAEPLGIAVFYDGGFLNQRDFDFSPEDYADNWGVGLRLLMMGSPLQLDLGFPINDPAGDADSTQFNFSFGTRF